jgi:hypothetical protein
MEQTYNVWTISYTELAGALLAGTVTGYFVSDQTEAVTGQPGHERKEAIAHFPVTSRYDKKDQYQRAVLFCNYLNRGLESQQEDRATEADDDVDILKMPQTAETKAAAINETMRLIGRLHRGTADVSEVGAKLSLLSRLNRYIRRRKTSR